MKKPSNKTIGAILTAFSYEEKDLIKVLSMCYKELPGNLNEKELLHVMETIDTLLVESFNHGNILADLITSFYEE